MPIFQDHDQPVFYTSRGTKPYQFKKTTTNDSEERVRAEFGEDHVVESPSWSISEFKKTVVANNGGRTHTSDRAELIERIKRGESPTWVPKQPIEDYYRNADEKPPSPPCDFKSKNPSPLLPAAELQTVTKTSADVLQAGLTSPVEIQRPRSALHAGDFTEEPVDQITQQQDSTGGALGDPDSSRCGCLGHSPIAPWFSAGSPPTDCPVSSPSPVFEKYPSSTFERHSRSRAPSLGTYSLSYVLKAPTSPLVQQSNNTDLDLSPTDLTTSPNRDNRRHTLPPRSSCILQSSLKEVVPDLSQENYPLSHHKGKIGASQKHRSRRSLTSNWSLQALTSPNLASHDQLQRPSFLEISPSQNASMVGSFEESILRGSMSTAPSKPLDFTAQIGVLGKGSHKPKCPAHVTIPFPAVFYSWGGVVGKNQKFIDDEPSPYVGHIDLQHSLLATGKRGSRESSPNDLAEEVNASADINHTDKTRGRTGNLAIRPSKKRRRTSPSSLAPQGGCYRIPQQGQLQIIIKNPNKTAVKLFLVPYDLTGMEQGTKTFIRQRSYSIEENCSISAPDFSGKNKLQQVKQKRTLRYLIHLNICSPSKGRFYLYQHIRVVFANRVPDNKEQLQNEIQIPQPRYSVYKPTGEFLLSSMSSTGSGLTTDRAYRRRSSGFEHFKYPSAQLFTSNSNFSFNPSTPIPPIPPLPFRLDLPNHRDSPEPEGGIPSTMNYDTSPPTPFNIQPFLTKNPDHFTSSLENAYKSSSSHSSEAYGKLSKGDVGYGGIYGRQSTPDGGEGLLARKLKGLGVRREDG